LIFAPAETSPAVVLARECANGAGCNHVNAAALFRLAEQLAKDGNVRAATIVLEALRHDPQISIRSEAAFRLAKLYEQSGDYEKAVDQYRAILAEQPKLGSVRLALAEALVRAGSKRQARLELRQALSNGLPNQVARAVNRFATVLRSEQRVGAVMEVGVAPDSNISRATTRDSVNVGGLDFILTPDARRRSGVGGYGQAQAYWRPKVMENVNILASLSGSANLYGESRFDDVAVTGALGSEIVGARSRLQLNAQFGQRYFGDHLYSRSYGGSMSVLVFAGRRTQVEGAVQISQIDYKTNDAQTGLEVGGSISIERQLSPRLTVRVTFQSEHDDAKAGAFTTWTYGATVLASRAIGQALLFGTASRFNIDGAAPFAFPPAQRQDALWQAQAGLQFAPVLEGEIKPVIRLRYASNTSPVFFYQYRQVRAEIGVAHDF
jgi:tetratricopeptide (TPR) repeat protein